MDRTVVIIVGMAGSGKTTFTQRLFSHASTVMQKIPFAINLDPAVLEVPFPCDIDIRDTLEYKDVMERFQLGPNGAILTALNLFSARFDLVLEQLALPDAEGQAGGKKNEDEFTRTESSGNGKETPTDENEISSLAIVDTPGQIEVFTWSASGTIITESIAANHPTVLIYIVDTPRCAANPATFMSNMLYACSLLYKSRLPLLVVFNKTDEHSDAPIREWMQDYELFQDALRRPYGNEESFSDSFMPSMLHSMSLVLEEFYSSLSVVGVSSYTGYGFDDLMDALSRARLEYFSGYRKLLDERIARKKKEEQTRVETELEKLRLDSQSLN